MFVRFCFFCLTEGKIGKRKEGGMMGPACLEREKKRVGEGYWGGEEIGIDDEPLHCLEQGLDWRPPMIAGGLWGCQEKSRQSEAHGRAGGPPLSLLCCWLSLSSPLHPRGPGSRGAGPGQRCKSWAGSVLCWLIRVSPGSIGGPGRSTSRAGERRAGSTPALC